jgi:hypothetical protein
VLATEGTWREAEDAAGEWRAVIAPALVASVGLLLVIVVFLCVRRLCGALAEPLAPIPLFITATGLLAWAAAVRLELRDRRIDWLAAIVLALFAFACSFPGIRAVDWLVWLIVFAAYGLIPARRSSPPKGSDTVTVQLLQELSRSRCSDGAETIRGRLVAEFAAGERLAILHVAFCPPFEQLPSMECEVGLGPACEVKVAQVLHQGARIEARLARASSTPERIEIEFVASACEPPPV